MITKKQNARFSAMLKYLKENNTYYKNILSEYNDEDLNTENINTIYENLEIISKKDILNNLYDYIDNKFKKNFDNVDELMDVLLNVKNLSLIHDKLLLDKNDDVTWNIETTTGVVGNPFPIIKEQGERVREIGYLLKCRRGLSKDIYLENGLLFLHPIEFFGKKRNPIDFSESNMSKVFQYMFQKKLKWIFATPTIIKKYANYAIKHNLQLQIRELSLEFIELTSEKISQEDKIMIENIFSTKIVINYSCREFWNIAYECSCNNLHINTRYLFVDLINENGQLIKNEGETGEVVITSLINKGMPFIKYYLGDYAKIYYNKKCECGCTSPIIVLEDGRKNEALKNTNLYGTNLFRKILREIYFEDYVNDINDIKIVQDGEFHLSVYLNKNKRNDVHFEEAFIRRFGHMIKNSKDFIISFNYYYPFEVDKHGFKEQIYISEIV